MIGSYRFRRRSGWNVDQLGQNLLIYLNANDYARMTDDGAGVISSWKDRTRAIDFVSSGTARPTWSATGYTGPDGVTRPGVTADGSDDTMTATTGVPGLLPAGAAAGEMWACGYYPTNVASTQLVSVGDASATTGARVIRRTGTAPNARHSLIADATPVTNPNITGINHFVVGFIYDGKELTGRINGRPFWVSTAVTLASSVVRSRIFASSATVAGLFCAATLREVAHTKLLTHEDRLRLEASMAWNSGHNGSSAMLAAGHLYFGGRP